MSLTQDRTKEDSFLISIYYERWTHDDLDFGEPGDRWVEVEREMVDADELKRYGCDYGISESSAGDPAAFPIWFSSASPRRDREHIEQGVDRFYYSLHVHEVNGREPEAEDYQKVANLIGVKFDRSLERADGKQHAPSMSGP